MPTPASPVPETQNTGTAAIQARPFEDDLSYLQAELPWIDLRCRRLIVRQMIHGAQRPVEDESYRRSDADPVQLRERHQQLLEQEHQLRVEIDQRMMASESVAQTPALIKMQDIWELTMLERNTLLLALGAQIRPDFDDHYRRLGENAFLSVGAVMAFMELDLRERIQERHRFTEEGSLMVLGLVEMRAGTSEPSMEELLAAMVVLTGKGFALMLGEVSLDDEQEPEPEQEAETEADERGVEVRSPRRRRRRCGQRDDEEDEKTRLEIPEVRLSDVILSTFLMSQVEELVAAASGRMAVLQRWGLTKHIAYGTGIVALFHGEPGVGKTFCARAVAGQLGKPLLEAHAPDLISHWVGQSARNFAAIFKRAHEEGAVLLLDECDAFVGQRGTRLGSGHDDDLTNALLTLIENHDGVIIMATNMANRLDAALARRVAYRLEFPHPDMAARAAIWRSLIPHTVPGAESIDFDALGLEHHLSGGLIKNAVLKATFRAARKGRGITQALLATAASEEVAAQAGASGNNQVRVVGFGR